MIPGILTAVIVAMGALKALFADDTKETIFNTIAKKLNSKAKKENAAASNQEAAATENSTKATKKDTASNFLNKLFKRKNSAPSGGGGQTQPPTFGKNGHRTFSG
jgi:membrane protein involved in colicin uptake